MEHKISIYLENRKLLIIVLYCIVLYVFITTIIDEHDIQKSYIIIIQGYIIIIQHRLIDYIQTWIYFESKLQWSRWTLVPQWCKKWPDVEWQQAIFWINAAPDFIMSWKSWMPWMSSIQYRTSSMFALLHLMGKPHKGPWARYSAKRHRRPAPHVTCHVSRRATAERRRRGAHPPCAPANSIQQRDNELQYQLTHFMRN